MIRFVERLEDVAGAPDACAWIVHRDDPAISPARATADDLADAARARTHDGGAARLWRRRLLRSLAGRWLGIAPETVVFERRPSGRARVVGPKPAFVSAASRGVWTMVAIGPAPLGVDVELAGEDIERFAAAHGIGADLALRRWTAAEACAKAGGLSLDAALEVVTEDAGWLRARGLGDLEVRYHPFAEGLAAAVVGRQGEASATTVR